MIEKTLIIQQYYHHHIPLVTLCGKSVKQSQTVRSRRFESSFLTWPRKPNTHVWEPSHPHNFSPFFSCCGTGPPPSTTEYADSAPACWPHENNVQCSKIVGWYVPRHGPIRYLSLLITIFLGMWLVRSNA